MIPAEIIKKKRAGQELNPDEIRAFVEKYLEGTIADYQMSALLMAVYFQGMSAAETWALTQTMMLSGRIVDLSEILQVKIDKHSTGGVGDKTSLILGPIVACAGVTVPMISGRGLGHTGGTLDKLESIPGFQTQLSLEKFQEILKAHGLCFIGQTTDICPADKRMYALRDVTGTVESVPLICASIMSKKLAEGIDGLILDVKFGNGAFMKTEKEALNLAKGLIAIAKRAKKKAAALLTNMNQPLGVAIGNAIEVQECVDVMSGSGPSDLRELSLVLSAQMIFMGKRAKNLKEAYNKASEILMSGQALQKFKDIIAVQGGTLNLPAADKTLPIVAERKGFISEVDAEKIGMAALVLGAGRLKTTDNIEPACGIFVRKKIGDAVSKGDVLSEIVYTSRTALENLKQAEYRVKEAYRISLKKNPRPTLMRKTWLT